LLESINTSYKRDVELKKERKKEKETQDRQKGLQRDAALSGMPSKFVK